MVDAATEPEAFLWRPASNMCTIQEAVGHIIAWPKNKCVEIGLGLEPEEITPMLKGFLLHSHTYSCNDLLAFYEIIF